MATDEPALYIIAYDIPHDRRRTKVHRLLCGYGVWTQYSLFECWLTPRQRIELAAKVHKLVLKDEDSIRIYALCGACQQKVITIGSPQPHDPVTLIL